MAKGTCFVIQGFGKKTDYTDGRILDLDASYEIIREAVVGAGLECIRADEIVHSGTIDKPMYEMLLDADLVIADLSTYNVNAAFELGVRYGLRPRATLIVAEEQFRNPFDVSHISIRRYRHLGEEIGYKEARRFRTELQQAIEALLAADSTDSPVYTFLPGLHPPRRPGLWLDGAVVHYAAHPPALDVDAFGPLDIAVGAPPPGAPASVPPPAAPPGPAPAAPPPAPSPPADSVATPSAKELLEAARACINPPAGQPSDFAGARVLLEQVRALRPNDPFVLQQLAFSIYKSRLPSAEAALQDARDVLLQLDPATTNDPETLGLWGAIHKRLWDTHRRREDLDRAINAYERGFHLRQDGYNGINLAYLLDLRAREALRDGDRPDEAVADSVQARRMRQEVLRITEAADAVSLTDAQRQRGDGDLASRYWRLAIRWEAALGLGDAATAARLDAEARALAVPQWMQATRLEQGDALCRLQAEVAAARAAR